jgi:hypothetical protein
MTTLEKYKELIIDYITTKDDKKSDYDFLRGYSFALKVNGWTEEQDKEFIKNIHDEIAQAK